MSDDELCVLCARFLPLWDKEIVADIKAGKRVVIAAHGNTLRALVKHLDGISGTHTHATSLFLQATCCRLPVEALQRGSTPALTSLFVRLSLSTCLL